MLAIPVTNAPTLPSAGGPPKDDLFSESDSESPSVVVSKIFDAEIENLLAQQLDGASGQHDAMVDGEVELVGESEFISTDEEDATAGKTSFPVDPAVTSPFDATSGRDVTPPITKSNAAAAGDMKYPPSPIGSNVLIATMPTSEAQAQATVQPINTNASNATEQDVANGAAANQRVQRATTLMNAATEAGETVDDIDEFSGQRQPEQAAQHRPLRISSEVSVSSASTNDFAFDVGNLQLSQSHVDRHRATEDSGPITATDHHMSTLQKSTASDVMPTSVLDARPVRVSNQMAEHVLSARQLIQDGRVQLEVTLDPPELGKITIELTEVDNQLSARFLVSQHTTLDAIRNSLPSMIDALNEAGLTLDDLQLENSAQDHQASQDQPEAFVPPSSQFIKSGDGGVSSHAPHVPSRRVDILA